MACAAQFPPRHWQADLTSSRSYVVWAAARPALERWCDAHQRYIYRGLTQRPSVLYGKSTANLARDFARHQPSDYVTRCDELASHLTEQELMTVRKSGVLPMWFWTSLADAAAPVQVHGGMS